MRKSSTVTVVGSQWGDEGKGKISDFLAERADIIVRYQGGPNAGHTVVIGEETYKLHHLPSGMFYQGKTCILGKGMVIDPLSLLAELQSLNKRGISPERLYISDRAHLIMAYHKVQDELEEKEREGARIGTTLRGIGPAYVDKVYRIGLRFGDLIDEEELRKKIREILLVKNRILRQLYQHPGFSPEEIEEAYFPVFQQLRPYITDTSVLLDEEIKKGARVLFEGAQGTMLDLDHGTYPFVTSSNPIAACASSGAGVGPDVVANVLGITKAYTTRVGEGPLPTELKNKVGEYIRERGREYGTTTGRPRRTGWLDGIALKSACRINGCRSRAVTLLDVLSGLDKVCIATAYRYGDTILEHFPSQTHMLEKCTPVYRVFKGWDADIAGARSIEDLPLEAVEYLRGLEEILQVKVSLVSVGPRRDQTIMVGDIF